MCTLPRRRQQAPSRERRVAVNAVAAHRVAAYIRELVAAGVDGDDLIFTLDRRLPDLAFRTFAAALALHRAETGAPGYAMLIPGAVQ
jgi:hypothetical protein